MSDNLPKMMDGSGSFQSYFVVGESENGVIGIRPLPEAMPHRYTLGYRIRVVAKGSLGIDQPDSTKSAEDVADSEFSLLKFSRKNAGRASVTGGMTVNLGSAFAQELLEVLQNQDAVSKLIRFLDARTPGEIVDQPGLRDFLHDAYIAPISSAVQAAEKPEEVEVTDPMLCDLPGQLNCGESKIEVDDEESDDD